MLASAVLAASATPPASVEAQLRATDQALLDAIAPGDKAAWDRVLTPDAVYVDENGTIIPRAEFLGQLTGLPPGASGNIRITDYKATVDGDTALVIMIADEHEDFHGHRLRAGYLMTETWLRRAGEWKLAMVHAYVERADPPAIVLPAAELDQYVGRYTSGTDLVRIIRREGDHLVAGREGRPFQPIAVEARDVLFTPGQPRTRLIFQRDAAGRVTGYIDRREGEDIPWVRQP